MPGSTHTGVGWCRVADVASALQLLCAALAGAGVAYAILTARGASEAAASAESTAEEAAEANALALARQGALDKRLYSCERALDELCLKTSLGVKRKGDHATSGE